MSSIGAPAPHGERLRLLRAECARMGVDGFYLPRTDEHSGEYLPADAERVAWLTGFTGSYAVVLVLADEAAVFTDGRYTVQVRAEVDPAHFEPRHALEEPLSAYLAERAPLGARIGYDPKLTKKSEKAMLERALDRRDGALAALERNPLDAIWRGRPERRFEKVWAHPIDYAGRSSAEKRAAIASEVAAAGADLLALTTADDIAWLLNVRGADIPYNPLALSFLLLDAEGGARFFVDPDRVEAALDDDVALEAYDDFWPALDGLSEKRVMLDPKSTNFGVARALVGGGAQIVEAASPVALAKAQKNPVERDGARAAHRRDGAAMARFLAWLDRALDKGEALDEAVAADRLDHERAKEALARGRSFETISAFGANAALPHYRFDPKKPARFGEDSLYLVDSGAQYLDGTTDVTRTIAVGRPSALMRRRVAQVLEAHIAVDRALFPEKATGAQIDVLARESFWAAGLDFDHGVGHGVGSYLCVHEGPARIAKSGDQPLLTGMILSNEPGYYREGEFGVRIENLLVVTDLEDVPEGDRPMRGFDQLTLVPIDRRAFDHDLLEPRDRAWLDAYHARVWREIEPLLEDGADLDWLRAACAPLAS